MESMMRVQEFSPLKSVLINGNEYTDLDKVCRRLDHIDLLIKGLSVDEGSHEDIQLLENEKEALRAAYVTLGGMARRFQSSEVKHPHNYGASTEEFLDSLGDPISLEGNSLFSNVE